MAYTKIIKVKSNLNLCLDYTSNPMKTERRSAEDLNKLLNYTQNNDKTEHQLYVSGFNCIPQNAYEIMMETKTRWRKPVKDGNILAYHIIQSFAPGEATPDQVHQIGCEFVQRFLADRFEWPFRWSFAGGFPCRCPIPLPLFWTGWIPTFHPARNAKHWKKFGNCL